MRTARLDVTGMKEARVMIGAMGDRARKPDRGLETPGNLRDLQASSKRRFARGLRRDSTGWRLEKQRRGLSPRPMVAHGTAEAAITRGVGPGRREIIFDARNGELRWGIKKGQGRLYYVQVHSAGYRSSKGRVKPRRIVFADKQSKDSIAGRFQLFLRDGTVTS